MRVDAGRGVVVLGFRSHEAQRVTAIGPQDFAAARDTCKAIFNAGRLLSVRAHGLDGEEAV